MIKVGLTGGIGSGKTLISEIFNRLGIPVFNADIEAKKILNSDKKVIQLVKKEFGEIYTSQGIDRAKLASIVFDKKEALQKLNAIIHPQVRLYFHEWVAQQNTAYIIEEAAILFESGAYKELDITINVNADELVRINRVIKRDHTTEESVKSRMKNQMSDQERSELADFTIDNNGDKMLLPQLLEIHQKILNRKS